METYDSLINNQDFVQKRITEQHQYMQELDGKRYLGIINYERYRLLYDSAKGVADWFQEQLIKILKK